MLEQIRKMVVGILKGWFTNKKVLDKLSESDEGNLLYNGDMISASTELDAEMSDESENPVQNKVIKEYVDEYAGKLDCDFDDENKVLTLKGGRAGSGTVELTEEHLTGETFMGKPVYEKVFITPGVNANASWTNIFSLSGLNMDKLINGVMCINEIVTRADIDYYMNKTAGYMQIRKVNSEDYSSGTLYHYIKYTKTTD